MEYEKLTRPVMVRFADEHVAALLEVEKLRCLRKLELAPIVRDLALWAMEFILTGSLPQAMARLQRLHGKSCVTGSYSAEVADAQRLRSRSDLVPHPRRAHQHRCRHESKRKAVPA